MSELERAVHELFLGNCTEFRKLLAEYVKKFAPQYTVSAELPPVPLLLSNALSCLDSHQTYIDLYIELTVPTQANGFFFFGQERSIYVETKNIDEALKVVSALSSSTEACVPNKARVSAQEFVEAMESKKGCTEMQITDTRITGLLARFEGYVKMSNVQFKFVSQLAKKARADQQMLSKLYRELSILSPTIRLIVSVVQW